MDAGFPLPLPQVELENLEYAANDHIFSSGIIVRMRENTASQASVSHPPVTLLPSPVPHQCYEAAKRVQCDFNLLMHKVAHDYDFLKDCLKETIKVDDYTRQLWEIYETVRKEGLSQELSLQLNRSDYMFHHEPQPDGSVDINKVSIKQIEFNTIASSFGGLCDRLSDHHRYILNETGWAYEPGQLPENGAIKGLASGIVRAWEVYGQPKAGVLFMVMPDEWNIYDQRCLEYTVKSINPKVKILRRALQDLHGHAVLSDEKQLMIDDTEISVVYFRMTYVPAHFHGPKDWEMRLLIERSRAIKSPSIHYLLAGTKKVQQVLAAPGVLARFLPDNPGAVKRIQATFAGQYSVDKGSEGDHAVNLALSNPERYVLKPQREGGGNNVWGEEICTLLKSIQHTDERSAYILMERIQPVPLENYILAPGKPLQLSTVVSELGIFGVVLGSAENILLNTEQGHILRTKVQQENEGGVAAGFAALDSPFLVG